MSSINHTSLGAAFGTVAGIATGHAVIGGLMGMALYRTGVSPDICNMILGGFIAGGVMLPTGMVTSEFALRAKETLPEAERVSNHTLDKVAMAGNVMMAVGAIPIGTTALAAVAAACTPLAMGGAWMFGNIGQGISNVIGLVMPEQVMQFVEPVLVMGGAISGGLLGIAGTLGAAFGRDHAQPEQSAPAPELPVPS